MVCPTRVRRRRSGNHELEASEVREGRNSTADRTVPGDSSWMEPFFTMLGLVNEGQDSDEDFLVVGDAEQHSHGMIMTLFMGGTLITVGFGGIHCIGWSFNFPSHAEQVLWRISSISITAIPLGLLAIIFVEFPLPIFSMGMVTNLLYIIILMIIPDHMRVAVVSGSLIILLSFLYILSRMLLLVLSLTTLRSLPSSAFQTVEWTTFLPHVV